MSKIKLKKIRIFIILGISSIIFATLLLASGYILGVIKNYENNFKSTIEQQKRADARLLLKDVVDRFDHAINENQVDPSSIESVSNWANYNFVGLRNGSIHSSGFILELGTEQYISDSDSSSYKTLVSNTKDSSSTETIFQNSSSLAKEANDRIKLGINSMNGDNVSLTQNNRIEWIEWAVYPTAVSVGINDEPKTINGNENSRYRKYVFLLRTDKQEVFESYKSELSMLSFLIDSINVGLIIGFIFLVSTMFFIVYTEFHKNPLLKEND